VNEELRLKYRYLDLRRPEMARNLRVRSKVATATRMFMGRTGLPGSRDPHPLQEHAGRRARVPRAEPPRAGDVLRAAQSPQQFKQILMVAGVERYYQIARCFRDEDSAPTGSSKFSQIDIEMSSSSARTFTA